jgi:hypothetical protein
MKMSGRRPRGRPHTRWIDQVKKDVKRRGDWRKVDEMQDGKTEAVGDPYAKVDPQVWK